MGHRAVAIKGKVYVCGGDTNGDVSPMFVRFDPRSGLWDELPPMSRGRVCASAVALAGCLYVCGGTSRPAPANAPIVAEEELFRSLEYFDPRTGAWTELPPMSDKRHAFAACTS